VSRAQRRASSPTTARSRRTPVQPSSSGRGLRVPWIPIAVLLGIVAVVAVVAWLVIQAGKPAGDRFASAAKIEADQAAGLPGQYVNLPEAWADGSTPAHYGASSGPNTNSHVTHDVDYSKEVTANAANGLPPAGGPHWGATTCGSDPATAPAFCGPVPWGIYRVPWPASSLVHNMEHAGVVVWYNTANIDIRNKIEAEATKRLKAGNLVVVTPYPDLPPDTIAMTAWARRDVFAASEYTDSRLDTFIKTFACRFNPENIPCK
jgi:hypothetical protein